MLCCYRGTYCWTNSAHIQMLNHRLIYAEFVNELNGPMIFDFIKNFSTRVWGEFWIGSNIS